MQAVLAFIIVGVAVAGAASYMRSSDAKRDARKADESTAALHDASQSPEFGAPREQIRTAAEEWNSYVRTSHSDALKRNNLRGKVLQLVRLTTAGLESAGKTPEAVALLRDALRHSDTRLGCIRNSSNCGRWALNEPDRAEKERDELHVRSGLEDLKRRWGA